MTPRGEETLSASILFVVAILITFITIQLISDGFNRGHDPQGEEQMEGTEQTTENTVDMAALLSAAATTPKGKTLKKFNPMESIPTLSVGIDEQGEGDIKPGQLIVGTYLRTERISSPKFVHSKEVDEKGVKVQYRHVLRLTNGQIMAIWSVGELKMIFKSQWNEAGKLSEGTLLSLKYIKRGLNSKQQKQHFFEYEVDAESNLQ
jgi:hypothetical protein